MVQSTAPYEKKILSEDGEEVDPHDFWDEINDGGNIEPEKSPAPLSIQEVLDAQRVAPFCNGNLSVNWRATGQFI